MSWYRVYRPQTVAGLHIGPVRQAFSAILSSGKFSHAYLLTGPKGTGKTSGARILAKVLNCEGNRTALKGKKPLAEPCNTCSSCVSITAGTSMCVTELDAASNRGIDDIKNLLERVGLAPADGVVSVYIIDEVHMLSTDAFNALLKTLEEPPEHVVFILATTELQKVPATIVSRCQVIQYRKATNEELLTALRSIVANEKLTLDEKQLLEIVGQADGSFRDGVKLLEQVASGVPLQGGILTTLAEDLIGKLAKKDFDGVRALFSSGDEQGVSTLQLQKQVLSSLHDRLLKAPAAKSPHLPTYAKLLGHLNVAPVPSLPFPAFSFEVACLSWCEAPMPVSEPLPPRIEPVAPVVHQRKVIERAPEPEPQPPEKQEVVVEKVAPPPVIEETVPVSNITIEVIHEKWHVLLREVHATNVSLEAILRATKPQEVTGVTLRLRVMYQFHKEQLELDRNLTVLEAAILKVYGARLKIGTILTEKAKAVVGSPDNNVSGSVEDAALVKAAEAAFL